MIHPPAQQEGQTQSRPGSALSEPESPTLLRESEDGVVCFSKGRFRQRFVQQTDKRMLRTDRTISGIGFQRVIDNGDRLEAQGCKGIAGH